MTINPALRPISEAKPGQLILAYSADESPMTRPGRKGSITLGMVADGPTPGLWTERYGLFKNFSELGVTWTHFAPVPTLEA